MPDGLHLIVAFGLALCAAFAATPVAMAVAARTAFHDRPVGYKGHAQPTPYLGGAAVLAGFLAAAVTLGGEFSRLSPIVAYASCLWALGTLDDRFNLPAWPRLLVQALIATGLWHADLGWHVFNGGLGDLALTIFWVVGLANAFNLMDNMDGAAATLALVTGVAIGTLATIEGDTALAILTFGLAGACLGFLPYNLAVPARIFLGDGGSLTIGFVIAASLMALPNSQDPGVAGLLAAVLLTGLPILDTTLVTISRRRAGLSVLTAGRDHLTHRLQPRLGTPRAVALTLAGVQAGLAGVAIGVVQLGRGSVVVAWSIWFVVAIAAVVLLETSTWAPVRDPAVPVVTSSGPVRLGPSVAPTLVEGLLLAFISLSCGLSPYLYGFYDVSIWGPIALGMLAALLGLLIARPAAPRRTSLVALGALLGFWLWALVSVGWAESADQAMTDANRWLLYVALFAVLVLLLRDDRLGVILLAAGSAAIAALGGYLLVRMLSGSGPGLFLGGRLHEPLGYVNGEAGFLLLGVWPLVAVAERVRNPFAAAAAMAGAVTLGGLVLLTQTRAVVPAVVVSATLLLVAVPGRVRRGWALVVVLGAIAVCIGPVLHVYDSAGGTARPGADVLRSAAIAILLAAVLAGAAWGAGGFAALRLTGRFPGAARFAWMPLVALAALGLTFALSVVDRPVERAKEQYREFTQLHTGAAASSRFATGAGNRYDYWRVAWRQFEDHPVRGIGAGNYDRTYFADRRTTEDVRQAHSIELQTLGELGGVGGALLLVFVAAVFTGLMRRSRAAREDLRQRGIAVAAGGAFTVWLVHTSVDWLHLIPGLTGLALCAAAVLVGPWRRPRALRAGGRRIALVVMASLLVVAGAVLVGRAALAQHYRAQGQRLLAADPVRALEKAGDSIALNDEALSGYYLESAAWARLGDYLRARAALVEATRREPHDFVPRALLGDLATRRRDFAVAYREYARASRLNPRDRSLHAAARQARRNSEH